MAPSFRDSAGTVDGYLVDGDSNLCRRYVDDGLLTERPDIKPSRMGNLAKWRVDMAAIAGVKRSELVHVPKWKRRPLYGNVVSNRGIVILPRESLKLVRG